MALEPVRLDDLTWEGMTAAIRTRIAPSSANQWTLHAPVDPGVTVLELLAWLLEQRVYWMDQTPGALDRAALALLGEKPETAKSAGTVLTFHDPGAVRQVDPGTEMRLAARGSQTVFTTVEGALLLPISEISVATDRDITSDLRHRLNPELFASNGEVRVTLWLKGSLPAGPEQEPLSLLFEVDAPAAIRPQWHPLAVAGVPPAATLSWHYRTASGDTVPFERMEDGTDGLRRAGIVRLWLPADWSADGPANPITNLTPYSFTIRLDAGRFTFPPRLASIAANSARAAHVRWTATHEQSLDWLPLPGNVFDTSSLPANDVIKDHPPLDPSVKAQLRESDGEWRDWEPRGDLTFAGAGDRVFVVDRDRGRLAFGDGLTGRVPSLFRDGGPNARVKYAVGGGISGNLGSGLKWERRDVLAPPLEASNSVTADGGAESETIAQARTRTAALLSRIERGVTAKDYEALATSLRGVAIARAHAALGVHPCLPCIVVPGAVTVFIVPFAPRPADPDDELEFSYVAAPVPDDGALTRVRERLDETRLVATEVYVLPVRYRAVSLSLTVRADTAEPRALRELLTRHMRAVLDPLGGTSAALATAWGFGAPLRPSALRKAAQHALGRLGDVVSVAIGLDEGEAVEDCNDVEIGEHELPYLAHLDVTLHTTPTGDGGLR